MTEASVAELAQLVAGRLLGDGDRRIVGLGDLRTAGPDRIGFVRDARYAAAAKATRAGALLTESELATAASQIVVDDVDVAYAKVALRFHPVPLALRHDVHPTAVVDPAAVLEEPVQIGPRAVVGKSRLGAGTVVGAGVVIGDGCSIGRDCFFHPNATVYAGVQIGQRVLVHANAVLGSDGFGYAREAGRWIKVPQLGTTVIEDDVEVGAGTTIDRATLGVTRIGARTKIDNLCHIAHNCTIGQDVAGNVGISGHLTIGADVRLGGGTVVLKDVIEPGDYMGHPLLEKRRFLRLLRVLRGLVPGRGDGE
jgi:UDP-3-O-[3-hydroxymyristoyl] glucosamine N-acyltransferase